MKPYRLEMQAFGPYLHKTEVDFEKLHASGLFLITGATGSGKTTILDAMSYALYGRATGTLRDARDMRSTAAPDDAPMRVAFELGLGGRRYRFERGIRLRLVKRRGGESERVPENEESCSEWVGGGWSLLCSGAQVRERAVELLGFSYEQFSQVVVLPQGEFRRLLTASSREKQEILETLFGTARWQNLTAALAARAKALGGELALSAARGEALLRGAGCADAAALEEKTAGLQGELAAQNSAAATLGKESARAQGSLAAARALAERFSQLSQARGRLSELAKRGEETEAQRGRLALAEQAEALLPYERALAQALREEGAAQQGAREREREARAADGAFAAAREGFAAFAGAEEKLRALAEQAAGLEKTLASAKALREALHGLRAAELALAGATARREELDARANACAAELAARQAQARELFERCVAPLPGLTERKNALERQAQALETLRERERTAARAAEALEAKRAEYRKQAQQLRGERQTLERMQAALDADAAFRLAGGLKAGEPCPVCGALEHPAPARPAAQAPAREELEAQKAKVAGLEEAARACAEEGARLHGEAEAEEKALAELRKDVPADLGAAAKELAAARQALARAQQGARRREESEAQARKLETEAAERGQAQQAARDACGAAEREKSRLEGRAAELAAAVPEAQRDADALEARIAALRRTYAEESARREAARTKLQAAEREQAGSRSALEAAQSAFASARERSAAAQGTWSVRFAASGLPEGARAEELALEEPQRAQLRGSLAAYDRELALQRDKTAALEQELAGAEQPDMAALEAQAEAARAAAEQAAAKRGALEAEGKSLRGVRAQLAELAEGEERLRADYALYERLAALCRGDNPLKTPVHQFVLGLMLDDILSCANVHLAQLAKNRYALCRAASPGRGGGTKGLDLTVSDAWEGGERSVNTLSGGEMFLASLSLAFGLSDVVQSYAGGIRLDSLFIDEGFGSLDAEALDTAMGALERLRRTGRLIGIISHVGDLRARIPARIEVARLPDGTASVAVAEA